jgi:hypothetical protein
MFLAKTAVLIHFKAVGVVLFVLHGIIISLFALTAGERYAHAHG